ncbi:MAG: beta-lactamase hydrolase domain-containing protein [Rehaibacterium terrae]|uniref:beta-lactamase hydrolase domain-containing protein n=1 Tax=Rehaibacterium terrae TaxID=1341696 RepID=UPI0039190ACF
MSRHRRPPWLILPVLGIALAGCAGAPVPPSVALPPGQPVTAPVQGEGALLTLPSGVVLMRTPDGVWVGAQPAAEDWPALAALGVRRVISLRTEAELGGRDPATEAAAAGLEHQQIPVQGAEGLDLDKADRLREALRGNEQQTLLYCASGNRAGALLALALARDGQPVEEAIAAGRQAGMRSTEPRVRELLGVPDCPETGCP